MRVSPRYLRIRAQNIAQRDLYIKRTDKCVDCGERATEFDHRDYFKPLEVDLVCSGCNTKRGSGYPPLDGPDVEVDWITSKKDVVKERRFELRISSKEKNALVKLAERRGMGKSAVVASMIRRAAKRAKVWE